MTVVLSSAIVVFGALVLLLLGSQVEMYRTIQQLREYSGLLDRPTPFEVGPEGERPGSVGLPADLDSSANALVLFLSDRCSTCRALAAALDGAVPRDMTIVLDPGDGPDSELGMTYRLDPGRTVLDRDRLIAGRVGVKATPAAVIVENGRMVRGTTVPSTRQLYALLESIRIPSAARDQEVSR
jgi:hypothetical protein